MPRYTRSKKGKPRRQVSVGDPYEDFHDFYQRIKQGQHRDDALARRETQMPYTPPEYDPDGGDFGPITPGKHAGMIEALELRYKKDDDGHPDFESPYVAWTYVIAEGEFKNRKVWNNSSLKSSSVNMPGGWYESGIAAYGDEFPEEMNREWEDEEQMVEYAAELVIAKIVTLAISNHMWQGKKQNDVQAVMAYEGDMPQLDTSELAAEPPDDEAVAEATPEPEEEKPKPKAKAKKGKSPPKKAPPRKKGGAKSDTDF
jgi:hypothetical protein